jgi:hypothetical protein
MHGATCACTGALTNGAAANAASIIAALAPRRIVHLPVQFTAILHGSLCAATVFRFKAE